MGGAISNLADDETPFGGRQPRLWTHRVLHGDRGGFRRGTRVGALLLVNPRARHQWVYVNFLENESEERVRTAYGADKYDRLKSLKRKYDPENFFRINQNIPPN